MEKLHLKQYKNDFVHAFDGDHSGNIQPRETPNALYSKAVPSPVARPSLLAWSEDLAQELGIENPGEKDLRVLGGNLITPTMYPYAACYAGHQFGNWAGQLGDGRAITLGEWEIAPGKSVEFQLKGAGPTPYSRRADGRAVLRSSLREYLMSEAMHCLGVPTTRALSLVSTGEKVLRDMFYDGHPEYETGAIVMRIAPTFLRFGNFEILAARQETDHLRKLTNWTIDRFFPHIHGENRILEWFREVMERTAQLMIEWMRVGFVHGVMNTDNMSILGLTIDYGPYSFVDSYDPDFTPNTTDLPGRRYAFGKQPSVAFWNLECLAGAIAPLFKDTEPLIGVLEGYEEILLRKYHQMMADKLGLDTVRAGDPELFSRFQEVLSAIQPDMTVFFQHLMELPMDMAEEQLIIGHFSESYYRDATPEEATELVALVRRYQARIESNTISWMDSRERMRQSNPRFILRNYLLHEAIEALENGDTAPFLKLQQAIKNPYSRETDQFFKKRPEWATRKAGCSMLSCSS